MFVSVDRERTSDARKREAATGGWSPSGSAGSSSEPMSKRERGESTECPEFTNLSHFFVHVFVYLSILLIRSVCACVQEKLLLRDQLWQSAAELQQQASFCSALGSAACGLLWSCSSSEDEVVRWTVQVRFSHRVVHFPS